MIAHLIGHSLFCAPNIEVLPFICDRSVYFVYRIELNITKYFIWKIYFLEIVFYSKWSRATKPGGDLKRGCRTRIDRSPDVIDFRPDSHGYVLMSFYWFLETNCFFISRNYGYTLKNSHLITGSSDRVQFFNKVNSSLSLIAGQISAQCDL